MARPTGAARFLPPHAQARQGRIKSPAGNLARVGLGVFPKWVWASGPCGCLRAEAAGEDGARRPWIKCPR